MSILTRPILEINLDSLVENFQALQKISGKATAAAVVKDDAYGLGAVKVGHKSHTHKYLLYHGGRTYLQALF